MLHHGAYDVKKKIRFVFVCSSKYNDQPLNPELMSGLDLTNSLSSVLVRFRQEKVAFLGDKESMSYQYSIRIQGLLYPLTEKWQRNN